MPPSLHIGLLLLGAAIGRHAAAAPAAPVPAFTEEQAVSAMLLDSHRGGFVSDNGLAVTLGLERVVTINGNIAEHSQLELGDLGRLTSGQAQLAGDAAGRLRLIQNGGGRFDVDMGAGVLGGTVIQNSLNDQLIRNQTVINASVNARGILQSMNFQSSLQDALASAVIRK